jgi:hypothetical protein
LALALPFDAVFGLYFSGYFFKEDVFQIFIELLVLFEVSECGFGPFLWGRGGLLRTKIKIGEADGLFIIRGSIFSEGVVGLLEQIYLSNALLRIFLEIYCRRKETLRPTSRIALSLALLRVADFCGMLGESRSDFWEFELALGGLLAEAADEGLVVQVPLPQLGQQDVKPLLFEGALAIPWTRLGSICELQHVRRNKNIHYPPS